MIGFDRKYAVLDLTAGPFSLTINEKGKELSSTKSFAAVPRVEDILFYENVRPLDCGKQGQGKRGEREIVELMTPPR